MKKLILLIILFQFSNVFASQNPRLLKILSFQEGSQFVTQINFDQSVENINPEVEFINQTVQVNLRGAEIPEKKNYLRVENGTVKSIYTYQADKELLRSRIIYFKPTKVSKFKNNIKVNKNGKSVKIVIDHNLAMNSEENLNLPVVKPKSLEKDKYSSKDLSTQLIAKEMGVTSNKALKSSKVDVVTDASLTSAEEEDLDESDIPVFVKAEVKASKAESPYSRILTSLGIVFMLGMGVLVFIKWWTKNHKLNSRASKIQVLTQHALGPKRNLAIIRVAGETILLGVTDHNISMIKELSLMDDEIPDFTPENFSSELNKELIAESPKTTLLAEKDEFSQVGIEDAIANRLKGMKSL